MIQLLAHLTGDYVLQNHWMALTKTSSIKAALVHALFYGIPFLALVSHPWQWIVIVGTHLVIDRFRLAKFWVDFWGVGKSGQVLAFIMRARGYVLGEVLVKPDVSDTRWVRSEFLAGFDEVGPRGARCRAEHRSTSLPYITDAPPWLAVWLLIINDNVLHMGINAMTLAAK